MCDRSFVNSRHYSVTDLPNVDVSVLRYPGATVDSLIRELDSTCFWIHRHDGIILCIAGNDLATQPVETVFSKLCDLARRLKLLTRFLTLCTIEYRLYPLGNRFGIDQETFRRKVVTINRKIKRFTRGIGCKNLDLGKRCFTLQQCNDGVHLTPAGRDTFRFQISRVVRAYLQQG